VRGTVVPIEPGDARDDWFELLALADEEAPLRAALGRGVLYGVVDTDSGRRRGAVLVLDRGEDEDVLPGGVESESRREAIGRALEVLPPRDRRVLTLYFGLEGNRPMTLQEIAHELGVTRERVRQLRDRALKRLRESDTADVLRDGMAA